MIRGRDVLSTPVEHWPRDGLCNPELRIEFEFTAMDIVLMGDRPISRFGSETQEDIEVQEDYGAYKDLGT